MYYLRNREIKIKTKIKKNMRTHSNSNTVIPEQKKPTRRPLSNPEIRFPKGLKVMLMGDTGISVFLKYYSILIVHILGLTKRLITETEVGM